MKEADIQIEFVVDGAGKATSLVLYQAGQRLPAKKSQMTKSDPKIDRGPDSLPPAEPSHQTANLERTLGLPALVATGTFEQLLTYVVFSGWLFYAVGAASIFAYRRRGSEVAGPYRVPGYPWTPLLFILSAGALVINSIVTQPVRAAVGLGVVVLGTPVYFIWRSHNADSRGRPPASPS